MNAAHQHQARIAPATVTRGLTFADLRVALCAGWRDFAAAPQFGLFFAGIYVAAGMFLYYTLFVLGEVAWLIPVAAGFPIIAPFIAVGLYEVSRRREHGLPLSWAAVLGSLRGRGDDQVLLMGGVLFVAFGFWIMIAHGIFAIFMANSGVGGNTLDAFLAPEGLAMLAVGSVVGAVVALAFCAVTVVSLPMLVDREVDFLTAIIVSLAAVRCNKPVLMGWAMVLGVGLFLAMLPFFLGLLVVLPVLAHATWHIYRKLVSAQ